LSAAGWIISVIRCGRRFCPRFTIGKCPSRRKFADYQEKKSLNSCVISAVTWHTNCAIARSMEPNRELFMEQQEVQDVEVTINEVISVLREADTATAVNPRETHILAAYMLCRLFGSEGICSRSWH
jgi:hypothetical protein